jgi:predicted nucleotidyltransferase
MNELDKAVEQIIGLFDELGLQYAIMGGIAVRVYGIPRATYDVDFTTAIPREVLPSLFQRVQSKGFTVPEQYLQGWLDQVGGMPLIKFRLYLDGRGVDVDVFLAESEFQETILTRRKRAKLNGNAAWLVSPEDLILLKLLANRPRDIADVGDVLFMQGELDLTYMRHWAAQLGLTDKLDAALRDQK